MDELNYVKNELTESTINLCRYLSSIKFYPLEINHNLFVFTNYKDHLETIFVIITKDNKFILSYLYNNVVLYEKKNIDKYEIHNEFNELVDYIKKMKKDSNDSQ